MRAGRGFRAPPFPLLPRRRVLPKPIQDLHPPVFGATGSRDAHHMMGELGLGFCSFSLGTPIEELREHLAAYHAAAAVCTLSVPQTHAQLVDY